MKTVIQLDHTEVSSIILQYLVDKHKVPSKYYKEYESQAASEDDYYGSSGYHASIPIQFTTIMDDGKVYRLKNVHAEYDSRPENNS
jgi:hypothetical protein